MILWRNLIQQIKHKNEDYREIYAAFAICFIILKKKKIFLPLLRSAMSFSLNKKRIHSGVDHTYYTTKIPEHRNWSKNQNRVCGST